MYEWLPGQAEAFRKKILESSGDMIDFHFNPPASNIEVLRCEKRLGLIFPSSHRQFLLEYNGADLFCFEDESTTVLTLDDIYTLTLRAREYMSFLSESEQYPIVTFACIEGARNFFSFHAGKMNHNEYPVLECFPEDSALEWVQIANSFDEWLRKQFNLTIR